MLSGRVERSGVGLAADVIDRVPKLAASAAYVKQFVGDKRIEHKEYIERHGEDMPEVREWKWAPA